jgi:nitroreductase
MACHSNHFPNNSYFLYLEDPNNKECLWHWLALFEQHRNHTGLWSIFNLNYGNYEALFEEKSLNSGITFNEIMILPVDSWYSAIFRRTSRRSFLNRVPEEEKIARLEKVCKEFRPFWEARTEFVKKSSEEVFKGVIGKYGKIKEAPFYIAFIGDMNSTIVQEAIGYTGEGIILEATFLGLATCWVGGFFNPENVEKHIQLRENEKVLAVTPVGLAEKKYAFFEKIFKGFVRSHRRKPLEKLVDRTPVSPWMKKALEAARLAPSAVNRQPWRFKIEEKAITVTIDSMKNISNISKRLDCGIAMLHLELGARAAGVEGRWEFLSPPLIAKYVFSSSY